MSKILRFTQFSVRDLIVTAGPTLLLLAAVCAIAYWLVDPAPPRHVTLATGQDNSAYEEFGKRYAAELAKSNIHVTLQPSLGSHENLQRLNAGQVDIAFVQSGSTEQSVAERKGLVSLLVPVSSERLAKKVKGTRPRIELLVWLSVLLTRRKEEAIVI